MRILGLEISRSAKVSKSADNSGDGNTPNSHGGFTRDSFFDALLSGGSFTNSKIPELYEKSPTLQDAVDRLGRSVEEITPIVNIGGELVTDTEIHEFITQPNSYEVWQDFIGRLARDWLLYNDAYTLYLGNNSLAPLEMYAKAPTLVDSDYGQGNYPLSYRIQQGEGSGFYQPDQRARGAFLSGKYLELQHLRGYSPRIGKGGTSRVSGIAESVRIQLAGITHNKSLLEKKGRLGTHFHFKDSPDADEFKRRQEHIKQQNNFANAGGSIVTAGEDGMEIKVLGQTNLEMDYKGLYEIVRREIYTRYNIPLALVTNDAATMSNVENSITNQYDLETIPVFKRLTSGLARVLKRRFKIDDTLEITFDQDQIPALKSRAVKQVMDLSNANVMTPDERREILGYEPLEGGAGAEMRYPANSIAVSDEKL